jgi:hypothetical protein
MTFPNIVFAGPGAQFSVSTLQTSPLGTALYFADGRKFRYGQAANTAIATGKLTQATINDANWDELVVPTARAAGVRTVTVTTGSTAVALNYFQDGWVNAEDDAGEGYLYAVESNLAAATTATLTISLAEQLQVAWTTATTVGLYASPYRAVIIHPSPASNVLTGVTPRAIPASNYGWFQVAGIASVLFGTATTAATLGESVVPHITVDGAVTGAVLTEDAPPTGHNQPIVGVVAETAADTEHGLVWLTIS